MAISCVSGYTRDRPMLLRRGEFAVVGRISGFWSFPGGCGKIAKAAGERRTSRKVGCCGPGKRAGFGSAARPARTMQRIVGFWQACHFRQDVSDENVGFAFRHLCRVTRASELCPCGFDLSSPRPREEPRFSPHAAGQTFPCPCVLGA